MAEVRFYADEHIARAVAIGLQQRGVDVVTAVEAAMLGAEDPAQLTFALNEGRVLLTMDSDFLALAASGIPHAGIAFVRQRTSVGAIIRGAALIHQVLTAEEMIGRTEYI